MSDSKNAIICIIAVAVILTANFFQGISLHSNGEDHMTTLHLIIELFSIIVSLLVVSMAWQSLDGKDSHLSNILIVGFTCIAGIDLAHALSYVGMPDFFGINSTSQAIFFWLNARFIELLVIALVSLRVVLPGSALLWQTIGITGAASVITIGVRYLFIFPVTFVPGHGVTPIKADFEYILCIGNLLASVVLFRKNQKEPNKAFGDLAMASFITGIGELAFTNHVETSDLINIAGHFYKIISYIFIYRGTFSNRLRTPYLELASSQQKLLSREAELRALVENVPVGIARFDQNLKCKYINPILEKTLGIKLSEIKNKHASEIIEFEIFSQFKPYIDRAMHGETVTFSHSRQLTNKSTAHRLVSVVPELINSNAINGVAMIFTDTTELEIAHRQLTESLKEIGELKSALDAHAIVAVTDTRGVITKVNEKFCKISKYSRDELIGNTHRVINSNYHTKNFFRELWETISSGNVWHGEICNRAKDGSLYWVYTTIVPFLGEDGTPKQYIAIRADITSRKLAEQEARRMAMHDALTGLPNRRLMEDRLQQAIAKISRDNSYGALFLLDLDNFKTINDTLGHAAGDKLLCEVAERLKNCIRQSDTVARLGGDEFVVVITELDDNFSKATTFIRGIGEKLREELTMPYLLEGQTIYSSPSIGATIFSKENNLTEELLKQADVALYQSKEEGKNRLNISHITSPHKNSLITTMPHNKTTKSK